MAVKKGQMCVVIIITMYVHVNGFFLHRWLVYFFSICRSQWNWRKKSKGNRISILKIITFDGFFFLLIIIVVVVVFFKECVSCSQFNRFFFVSFSVDKHFWSKWNEFLFFFSCFIYVCLFVFVLMIKCKNPFTHWQR